MDRRNGKTVKKFTNYFISLAKLGKEGLVQRATSSEQHNNSAHKLTGQVKGCKGQKFQISSLRTYFPEVKFVRKSLFPKITFDSHINMH
jgi:hypothetical protein